MVRARAVFGGILVALAASRLCHVRILWPDGDYHLAAAAEILRGSAPYRDFWFDKPPLTPLLHVLFGARPGVWLMLASAGYLLLACWLAHAIAKKLWGEREGLLAAALLALHLVFYLPAAVIPIPVDLAMLVPHLAAIAFLASGWPALAGALAGVGFFFNVKALFVLAVCVLWRPERWLRIAVGFTAVVLAGLGALAAMGALRGYWEQVWMWGIVYAGSSPDAHPYLNGLKRTANWVGFHAAIALGTLIFFLRERGERFREAWIWVLISAAAVCLGLRFSPRYYFHLLPALVVFGARGLLLALEMRRKATLALTSILLLVPAARFGPRYATLAGDLLLQRPHHWSDIALDQDSRAAARIVSSQARTGDTLLVWGYRAGIHLYTGLKAGSRFLDSQPLTGVPAERHFTVSKPVAPDLARANRAELLRSRPSFIVDSLAVANPGLGIDRFPDLLPWLAEYDLAGRTPLSLVYRRRSDPGAVGVLADRRGRLSLEFLHSLEVGWGRRSVCVVCPSACAGPRPLVFTIRQPGLHGVALHIPDQFFELLRRADPVVVGLILPERQARSTENPVGPASGPALQPVHDLRELQTRLQNHMHVVGHDDPGMKKVQPAHGFSMAECLLQHAGDAGIAQPERT